MASERKSADAFEAALKREIQRMPIVNGADCPAPDILAAYYDRALARSERARVDSHLTSCARCQSMMAAIARADDSQRSPEPEPARWLFWVTRLVAPIAVVGVIVALAIGMRTREQQAPEVIALASPVAEMKPQPAQTAPAPPSQPLPEALAPSVPESAKAPAARMLGEHHHTVGSREKAAIARKPKPEEHAREEIAKAETVPALSQYSSSSPAANSSSAPATAPGAPLEAASAPAMEAGNAAPSEAQVAGAAVPGIAGAAPGASALQAPTPVNEAGSSASVEGQGASAAVARSVGAMAEAPRMNQISSPDGSVAWQFGAGGAIMRSGNAGPWLAMPSGVTTDLLAASAPSNDVCWMAGKSGTIVRTLDGGAHWRIAKPPSPDNFIAITATDSNNATVIAVAGQRYVTHDGGVTWSSP